MLRETTTRVTALLAITGALLVGAFAVAQAADAATIYACVKKGSGTARIVSKKAKCRKGESRLTWSSQGPAGKNGLNGGAGKEGPAGKNGTNGTNGTNGANGAVAGYSITQSNLVTLGAGSGGEIVLGEEFPAGKYMLSGKADIHAEAGAGGFVDVACELFAPEEEDELLDLSEFTSPLAELKAGEFAADGTDSMQSAVNFTKTTLVLMGCFEPYSGGVATGIGYASLHAVQLNTLVSH